uniref:SH3 domain-binding protein 5 n=1 Tax=Aceria tosichella TaxID=561515 RepID=A0A6G1SKA2_9ACAR
MEMTNDTVTASADVILVHNGPNNESNIRANNPESPISPATILQKHGHMSSSSTLADEQQRLADVIDVNEVGENFIHHPLASSSSQPSESTSSTHSDIDELKKDNRNSLNENNNTISRRAHIDETLSDASQTSTELNSSDYSPNEDHLKIKAGEKLAICYNPVLDDEIRNRLDKLNALSDLINSLEVQFDQANILFRETLKCSTDRLSTIAKTLGSKSIRHGRVYRQAKISVEQTQTDCQRACVQFEQANHDHQFAKEAIREAEMRLKQMNIDARVNSMVRHSEEETQNSSFEFNDLGKLSLDDTDMDDELKQGCSEYSKTTCDSKATNKASNLAETVPLDSVDACTRDNDGTCSPSTTSRFGNEHVAQVKQNITPHVVDNHDDTKIMNAARLSEDLNRAINRLLDAEQKRRQSEKLHLDQANKLMVAQENLMKLEREHGTSIKRSQVYFDEAKRFNIRLNAVKNDIARISEEISAAKQAYARALNDLEQFSEDLHLNSNNLSSSKDQGLSQDQVNDGKERGDDSSDDAVGNNRMKATSRTL